MGKATRLKDEQPKLGPTPEQNRLGLYVVEPGKVDKGQITSSVYRKRPWFESLAKRDQAEAARDGRPVLIDKTELQALRFYRAAYEGTARSEMRCALNQERGTGSGDMPHGLAIARRNLALCESGLGALVDTMRAIVLHDQVYAAIAMARFGTRDLDVYDDASGTFTSKPAPRSNRHLQIIREEFQAGTVLLVGAVQMMVRTGD